MVRSRVRKDPNGLSRAHSRGPTDRNRLSTFRFGGVWREWGVSRWAWFRSDSTRLDDDLCLRTIVPGYQRPGETDSRRTGLRPLERFNRFPPPPTHGLSPRIAATCKVVGQRIQVLHYTGIKLREKR